MQISGEKKPEHLEEALNLNIIGGRRFLDELAFYVRIIHILFCFSMYIVLYHRILGLLGTVFEPSILICWLSRCPTRSSLLPGSYFEQKLLLHETQFAYNHGECSNTTT